MKVKHSKALLISAILGLLYTIYLISYFGNTLTASDSGAEITGTAIATALVMPHMALVLLGTIFNWISYFTNRRAFALTCGVLYSVSGVVFIFYIYFVIPSIVLSFVGFANLQKINELQDESKNSSEE